MSKMRIKGVKPWDGEYELDEDRAFNAREWSWIKKISGYGPLTLGKGFKERDPQLFVALSIIAMCRDGKVDRDDGLEVAEELSEAPFDFESITLIGEAVEDVPLASTSEPEESSRPSSLESKTGSGEDSRNGSETSDVTPLPTTPMRSGTSSA